MTMSSNLRIRPGDADARAQLRDHACYSQVLGSARRELGVCHSQVINRKQNSHI